jgi:geranylgeranyl pyrophosphate synthase
MHREVFIISLQTTIQLYPFPREIIKNRMREVLHTGNPDIDAIMEYLVEGSGKMLRPRLVYLTSSFYPHEPEVKKDIAVAVELIHLAYCA